MIILIIQKTKLLKKDLIIGLKYFPVPFSTIFINNNIPIINHTENLSKRLKIRIELIRTIFINN